VLILAAEDGFPASVLPEEALREYVDLLVRVIEAAGVDRLRRRRAGGGRVRPRLLQAEH
jgi:hypothetical protein